MSAGSSCSRLRIDANGADFPILVVIAIVGLGSATTQRTWATRSCSRTTRCARKSWRGRGSPMRRRRKHEARHLILKADTPHPHPLARNKSSSWTRRDMMNHTSPRAPASLDPWQRDVSCVDVRAVGMAIRGELAFGRGSIAPQPCIRRARGPPSLLTTAACGGLRSTPDCRPRRALLHLSYSYAAPCGPALLVTQCHKPTCAVQQKVRLFD